VRVALAAASSRYGLTRDDLCGLLDGEPRYRVEQVWDGLYRRLRAPAEMTELPASLRLRLEEHPSLQPAFELCTEQVADGGATVKWLLVAADGSRIETVLMRYRNRVTACVSSQAGCAMACSFCATGQIGFGRNLGAAEITEQVVRAARACEDLGWGRLGNLVMMGMGEPLANYRSVLAALRRCNEDLGIGARAMTVSTVGIIPGIRRLAAEPLQVNLAVSLHAANDELRDSLVPVNRRYPIAALMEACTGYTERTRRRISFEWACIAGVNDRRSDAEELARLARPLRAHVNLIPLNPTPGFLVAGSTPGDVRRFRDDLLAAGVNTTIRNTRGREVDGACGQLAGGGGALRGARVASRP
jgi:23S rRNA (adenine2503-C2)-methyltransferase